MTKNTKLSEEGHAFLQDPLMHQCVKELAFSVGATPEEYLLRFEEVLFSEPEVIFSLFEKGCSVAARGALCD